MAQLITVKTNDTLNQTSKHIFQFKTLSVLSLASETCLKFKHLQSKSLKSELKGAAEELNKLFQFLSLICSIWREIYIWRKWQYLLYTDLQSPHSRFKLPNCHANCLPLQVTNKYNI